MEDRLVTIEARVLDNEGEVEFGTGALLLSWLIGTMLLWLLAFYELPSGTPEWVRRAQYACFGTTESGLPSVAGWMVLILGPLALILGILVALPEESFIAAKNWIHSSKNRLLLAPLLILAVIEAGWVVSSIVAKLQTAAITGESDVPLHLPETYPKLSGPAPNFALVDQTGKTITLDAARGKPVLVSFVYSHCQTVCPILLKNLLTISGKETADTTLMFITLDPWRDTPSSLSSIAAAWELPAGAHILSGTPDKVNGVLDSYNVARTREEKNGEVVHPALVYVIDGNGNLVYLLNNPSAVWLKEAIERAKLLS